MASADRANIVTDKSKIDRVKKIRVKVTTYQKHVENYENLIGIGVYCRDDKNTLQYKENSESVVWVLWYINLCRLFNAKFIFIQIISSISNNSV